MEGRAGGGITNRPNKNPVQTFWWGALVARVSLLVYGKLTGKGTAKAVLMKVSFWLTIYPPRMIKGMCGSNPLGAYKEVRRPLVNHARLEKAAVSSVRAVRLEGISAPGEGVATVVAGNLKKLHRKLK